MHTLYIPIKGWYLKNGPTIWEGGSINMLAQLQLIVMDRLFLPSDSKEHPYEIIDVDLLERWWRNIAIFWKELGQSLYLSFAPHFLLKFQHLSRYKIANLRKYLAIWFSFKLILEYLSSSKVFIFLRSANKESLGPALTPKLNEKIGGSTRGLPSTFFRHRLYKWKISLDLSRKSKKTNKIRKKESDFEPYGWHICRQPAMISDYSLPEVCYLECESIWYMEQEWECRKKYNPNY